MVLLKKRQIYDGCGNGLAWQEVKDVIILFPYNSEIAWVIYCLGVPYTKK